MTDRRTRSSHRLALAATISLAVLLAILLLPLLVESGQRQPSGAESSDQQSVRDAHGNTDAAGRDIARTDLRADDDAAAASLTTHSSSPGVPGSGPNGDELGRVLWVSLSWPAGQLAAAVPPLSRRTLVAYKVLLRGARVVGGDSGRDALRRTLQQNPSGSAIEIQHLFRVRVTDESAAPAVGVVVHATGRYSDAGRPGVNPILPIAEFFSGFALLPPVQATTGDEVLIRQSPQSSTFTLAPSAGVGEARLEVSALYRAPRGLGIDEARAAADALDLGWIAGEFDPRELRSVLPRSMGIYIVNEGTPFYVLRFPAGFGLRRDVWCSPPGMTFESTDQGIWAYLDAPTSTQIVNERGIFVRPFEGATYRLRAAARPPLPALTLDTSALSASLAARSGEWRVVAKDMDVPSRFTPRELAQARYESATAEWVWSRRAADLAVGREVQFLILEDGVEPVSLAFTIGSRDALTIRLRPIGTPWTVFGNARLSAGGELPIPVVATIWLGLRYQRTVSAWTDDVGHFSKGGLTFPIEWISEAAGAPFRRNVSLAVDVEALQELLVELAAPLVDEGAALRALAAITNAGPGSDFDVDLGGRFGRADRDFEIGLVSVRDRPRELNVTGSLSEVLDELGIRDQYRVRAAELRAQQAARAD